MTRRDAGSHDMTRRRLLLVDGILWRVWELGMPHGVGTPALVFESEGIVRRVRRYPIDWMELDAAALIAVAENV